MALKHKGKTNQAAKKRFRVVGGGHILRYGRKAREQMSGPVFVVEGAFVELIASCVACVAGGRSAKGITPASGAA